jgi:hypothetical protein
MFLEFADKNINEFKCGHVYFKNEGKPFEVKDSLGNELLTEFTHVNGVMVQTFQVPKVEKKEGGKK